MVSFSNINEEIQQKLYSEMKLSKTEMECDMLEREEELLHAKNCLDECRREVEIYKNEAESLKESLAQHEELSKTHNVIKDKMADLMGIIDKQNEQINHFKEKESSHDTIMQRYETLQKELHVLKVTIQQKELDLKSLNQLLENKEEEINEKEREMNELKKKLESASVINPEEYHHLGMESQFINNCNPKLVKGSHH